MPKLHIPTILLALCISSLAQSLQAAETVRQVEIGECRARITVYADPKGIDFKNGCQMSLHERLATLGTLMKQLPQGLKSLNGIRYFSTGRMETSTPEFSSRLALAASQDKDWDNKQGGLSSKGQQKYKNINDYVTKLANDQQVYKELRTCFNAIGLDIVLNSVEKVLIGKRENIPLGSLLYDHGISRGSKLPFDAITWYGVIPLNTAPEASTDFCNFGS